MKAVNLHMVMLGCTPKGRFTEQHDIFFGIGSSLRELVPDMKDFWPEAKGRIHIDAWQKVTIVDGFTIEIVSNEEKLEQEERESREKDEKEDQLISEIVNEETNVNDSKIDTKGIDMLQSTPEHTIIDLK